MKGSLISNNQESQLRDTIYSYFEDEEDFDTLEEEDDQISPTHYDKKQKLTLKASEINENRIFKKSI